MRIDTQHHTGKVIYVIENKIGMEYSTKKERLKFVNDTSIKELKHTLPILFDLSEYNSLSHTTAIATNEKEEELFIWILHLENHINIYLYSIILCPAMVLYTC